jgi:hypothetical protein
MANEAERIKEAEDCIAAMASDGWLYFGPEGMSDAQQMVSGYCLKYRYCLRCKFVHDPLSVYDHEPKYEDGSASSKEVAK